MQLDVLQVLAGGILCCGEYAVYLEGSVGDGAGLVDGDLTALELGSGFGQLCFQFIGAFCLFDKKLQQFCPGQFLQVGPGHGLVLPPAQTCSVKDCTCSEDQDDSCDGKRQGAYATCFRESVCSFIDKLYIIRIIWSQCYRGFSTFFRITITDFIFNDIS